MSPLVRWRGLVAESALPHVHAPSHHRLTEFVLGSKGFARAKADKPAFVEALSGMQRSFGDVTRDVARAKGAFAKQLGLGKGKTAVLVTPNHVDFPIALLSVVGVGAVLSTLNPAYQRAEIAYQLKACNASLVIAHPTCLHHVLEARKDAPGSEVIALDGDGDDHLIPAGVQRFSALLHAATPNHTGTPCLGEDVALLPFSSGTTGLPKGVKLSHNNLCVNLLQIDHPNGALKPNDVLISPLPFFHIYALTISMLFHLWAGTTVVTMKKYDGVTFCESVQKWHATRAHIVPPIVIQLVKDPALSKFDLATLTDVLSAAAPLGATTEADCSKRFPKMHLRQAWGMTELSPIATMVPNHVSRQGSVGPPVASTSIKVVDVNTREALPPGQEGELCVKGPQVMLGYDRAEETVKCLDAEGWLSTGDIAYIERDGYVTVTDRIKELIKVSGFQVSASELEALLMTHDNVVDAAVIPRLHEKMGEVPCAYVVVRENRPGFESELVEWAAPQVVHYKKLRGGIVIVDKLPKTASGKLLRREVLKEDRVRHPGPVKHIH